MHPQCVVETPAGQQLRTQLLNQAPDLNGGERHATAAGYDSRAARSVNDASADRHDRVLANASPSPHEAPAAIMRRYFMVCDG